MTCTGISANWCPIHGDCTCKHPEDRMDDEDCPLHCPWSTHADEDDEIETIWGPIQ